MDLGLVFEERNYFFLGPGEGVSDVSYLNYLSDHAIVGKCVHS